MTLGLRIHYERRNTLPSLEGSCVYIKVNANDLHMGQRMKDARTDRLDLPRATEPLDKKS